MCDLYSKEQPERYLYSIMTIFLKIQYLAGLVNFKGLVIAHL